MNPLTTRDREYLRIIYSLKGDTDYIGPVKLANTMGISKVCAFQKMQRLSVLGYGTYKPHDGLLLNKKAIDLINMDMKRHHILETFLQNQLNLTHHQACKEAENLTESMSAFLFQCISQNTPNQPSQCCNYSSGEKLTPEIMQTCPWIKKSMKK